MTLKTGDILEFTGDELAPETHIMEVRAVLDSIIFFRDVLAVGVSSTSYMELEDLVAFGWKLKSS